MMNFHAMTESQEKRRRAECIDVAIKTHIQIIKENRALDASKAGISSNTTWSLALAFDELICFFVLQTNANTHSLSRVIIQTLIHERLFLPLETILDACLDCFLKTPHLSEEALKTVAEQKENMIEKSLRLLTTELRLFFLQEFPSDEIESLLSGPLHDIYDRFRLLQALHEWRANHPKLFTQMVEMTNWARTATQNPAKELAPLPSTVAAFQAFSEKLNQAELTFHQTVLDRRRVASHNYPSAFFLFAELTTSLSRIKELINISSVSAEYRLTLNKYINISSQLIDFSKIQISL